MNIFNKIFGETKSVDTSPSIEIKVETLEDFTKLSSDKRMLILMKFGDIQPIDNNHFPFFQYAILSDPDKHVRLAALKRIHAFKDHPSIMPMMRKLMTEINDNDLEPYFSMSLIRLGLISPEDFENKINNLQ